MLNSNVMDLAFSPDGAFLFTVADRDPAVKAWWAGNASLKLGMTMKGGGANFWGEREFLSIKPGARVCRI